MLVFTVLFGISLVITSVVSLPEIPEDDDEIPSVEPEYLDMLLKTKQYEEFSQLMGIENVELVQPRERARNENPMYHKELHHMDILPPRKKKNANEEEGRQAIRFDVNRRARWPKNYVPYVISDEYEDDEKEIIKDAINNWNKRIKCIKFKPRTDERDYVFYFSGDGCYSHMGRTGRQQPISMEVDGCLSQGTINHEMEHAVGMDHEMNRQDRDDYVKMLWKNILDDWKDQFEKTDPEQMRDILDYDYYSLMHYALESPDNEDKPAFKILEEGIDESKVGNADDFTRMDVKKINALYCD